MAQRKSTQSETTQGTPQPSKHPVPAHEQAGDAVKTAVSPLDRDSREERGETRSFSELAADESFPSYRLGIVTDSDGVIVESRSKVLP